MDSRWLKYANQLIFHVKKERNRINKMLDRNTQNNITVLNLQQCLKEPKFDDKI